MWIYDRIVNTSRPSEISQSPTIDVVVNGQSLGVDAGTTLAQLIEKVGSAGRACAAEVNQRLVPKREHAARILEPGDRVELVSLVGGG